MGRVVVRGDVDLTSAPGVLDALLHADAGGPVALRLSEVTFMDSSGLRALLQARASMGWRLWLVAPSPPVRRLLAVSGVRGEFSTVLDEREIAAV
jgi:anti-anti-sigma factor